MSLSAALYSDTAAQSNSNSKTPTQQRVETLTQQERLKLNQATPQQTFVARQRDRKTAKQLHRYTAAGTTVRYLYSKTVNSCVAA